MMRSMTGFGRGEAKYDGGKIRVEIKTINHKFFDVSLRLPESIVSFEDKVKEVLQDRIQRGKIYIMLVYDGIIAREESVSIDKRLAKKYYDELKRLNAQLGLRSELSLRDIVGLPGVINARAAEKDVTHLWAKTKEAIEKAVRQLIHEREKEGRHIYKDFCGRIVKIEDMLEVIKERAHVSIEEYRKRFANRIKGLTSGRDIDMGRLEMEVAIFAKNSDIAEEITRLRSHLMNLKKTLSGTGEIGKKIDFIAQELHREINTVGSKSSDFKISKNVIEIKSEIEKIREQAKNIE